MTKWAGFFTKGYAGAVVHAYLGLADYDQTFSWLEQAYKKQSNIVQHLKVDPLFDPIRGDLPAGAVIGGVGQPPQNRGNRKWYFQFGHEIVATLGVGGMGEVYRAPRYGETQRGDEGTSRVLVARS